MSARANYIRPPNGVITCSLPVIQYLCANARADEIVQYEALTGRDYDADEAAVGFYMAGPWRIAATDGEKPIAAGGYQEITPGVFQSWMVGTQEGWDTHWRTIHRITRFLIQQMEDSGRVRRFQTNALASRTRACAWYERLGMTYEGTMRGMGVGGEDVAMYGRVVDNVEAW